MLLKLRSNNTLPGLQSCLLIVILIISFGLNAQTFEKENILSNGDPDKFINIVFLGDGFKNDELSSFISNIRKSSDFFFSVSPFSAYKNYFNVLAIKVPSNESGSDHPRTATDCPSETVHPLLTVDTYFNSTFDSNKIHRLLISTNYQAINNVMINNFPLFDQKIMMVNTSFYGGSGGSTATASLHNSTNELVMHEGGHSFAGLADEYWAGDNYAAEKVNMTKEANPALVKWKNWLGVDGVGIYPYGTTGIQSEWYRPHNKCKMLALGYDFCPVCKEAIALSILKKFGTPIESFLPDQSDISVKSESTQFRINLYKPNPNTLRTKWLLNGIKIASNSDSVLVGANQLSTGKNSLSVQVLDTTSLIRADSHAATNTFSINWTINKLSTGIDPENALNLAEIYPNPFTSDFVIETTGNQRKTRFEILNVAGQVIYHGIMTGKVTVQTSSYAPGVYFIKLENVDSYTFKKIIKK